MNAGSIARILDGLAVCAIAFGCAGLTYAVTRHSLRTSAIDAGVGEWAVGKYGSTEFRWKTNRVQPVGPPINLAGRRYASIPWDSAWTNGVVIEPLSTWQARSSMLLGITAESLVKPPVTNYTLPFTPPVWSSTNIMYLPAL